MMGLLENYSRNLLKPGFKAAGNIIMMLGLTGPEMGGSDYSFIAHDLVGGELPQLDLEMEKRIQRLCLEANKLGLFKSAHDCSRGGMLITVIESCFYAEPKLMGAELKIESELEPEALLFGESYGRVVVSLDKDKREQLEELAKKWKVDLTLLGEVINDEIKVRIKSKKSSTWQEVVNMEIEHVRQNWRGEIGE